MNLRSIRFFNRILYDSVGGGPAQFFFLDPIIITNPIMMNVIPTEMIGKKA